MSQSGDDPATTSGGLRKNLSFTSDASFLATPANAAQSNAQSTNMDTTFIKNQLSLQRSSSVAQSHVSALSHQLSQKSNGSHELAHQQAIAGVMGANQQFETRGHGRGDSISSLVESVKSCTLKKSDSAKSVKSIHAVGSYPLNSLQVHDPLPMKKNAVGSHECLKSGDVVIVRDVPAGTIFGCDTTTAIIKATGEFDGIKDIPHGNHFIWAASSADSIRNGFWIVAKKRASDEFGEINVKRWNSYDETMEEQIIAAEERIQKSNLPEIIGTLKSYSMASSDKYMSKAQGVLPTSQLYAKSTDIWYHLTSCIKGSLLTRITGGTWNKWSVSSSHECQRILVETYRQGETMESRKNEVLNFMFPTDRRAYAAHTYGPERTQNFLDTSTHITIVIENHCTFKDSDEIIGELQFCYVVGMTLGNAACQEHWGYIVKILFRAHRLALENPAFFRKVIEAVHAQLIYDDTAFDGSIFDQNSDLEIELKLILTTFKSRLNEQLLAQGSKLTASQKDVGKAFEELESWLWKWGWDLRGNSARTGKIQLEDGDIIDVEMMEFEAEDERGRSGLFRSLQSRRSSHPKILRMAE